jgi:hypothetical protein
VLNDRLELELVLVQSRWGMRMMSKNVVERRHPKPLKIEFKFEFEDEFQFVSSAALSS